MIITKETLPQAMQLCVDAADDGGKVLVIKDQEHDRSLAQNALAFKLYQHIDNHQHTTNAREYCKYHFGVSILIADDEDMMGLFKQTMADLSYEARVDSMKLISVTSLMKVKQFTAYLEKIYNHFDPKGYALPKPVDLYARAMGVK